MLELKMLKTMALTRTHSSKRVGDSEPYGGDKWRDKGEGQESKHRQREDSAGHCENAPQAHIILEQSQNNVTCCTKLPIYSILL